MNDQLALEAQLSLYGDTVCRDTGHYFCTERPFSTPRFGNKVSFLNDGRTTFEAIHREMRRAERFIWIADWQMSHDVELIRSDDPSRPHRLHKIIEDIIKSKPVHVRILLYKSVFDDAPGTFDNQAKKKLESLNAKGYPGSVAVLLQGPTSTQNDRKEYSHHQKFVVVDGKIAFIGGIDLANGRWETPNFDVVVDPLHFIINEIYNPGARKGRGTTTEEKKLIKTYGFAEPWFDDLLDEGCQPRMPWQDVHIRIEGPSVVDIHRNFVRRWNVTHNDALLYGSEFSQVINKAWLKKVNAWDVLKNAQEGKNGGAIVQIVRSVSSGHLKEEGVRHDDHELFPDSREREIWKKCLPKWEQYHQNNILNAVINCIRAADNYIYIETQFFISGFGKWGQVDSTKIGNENNGINNGVVQALGDRISHHIRAKSPFHVYLVIPAHPEGDAATEQVWKQHWLALASIKHGSDSLINRISKTLRQTGRDEAEWKQYLTVLNMRNFGATIQYARDPHTNNEDFRREIGRYVVTEQIYVHSKLMIVDDAVAIIGSANTNDRSLTGNGDTEIAAVVVDTEGVERRDLGSPNFTVQTRKFARELRRQLWTKHFGFMIKERDYFNASKRAERNGVEVAPPLPYPPRAATREKHLMAVNGNVAFQDILDKPCSPQVVQAIQRIAASNRRVYERVFTHTPRHFDTFEAGSSYFKLPYPLLVDKNSVNSLARLQQPQGTQGTEAQRRQNQETRIGFYNRDIERIIEKGKMNGIIPPSLADEFMSKVLNEHQISTSKNTIFGTRYVLHDNKAVHNINKAIDTLSSELVGFLVEAPLDWGIRTKITGDPTKIMNYKIDIANQSRNSKDSSNIG